ADDGQLRAGVDDVAGDGHEAGLLVRHVHARQALDLAGREGCDRPRLGSAGHEVVPVCLLTDPGDVEAARAGLPGVGHDVGVDEDVGGLLGGGAVQTAAGHVGDRGKGHGDHGVAPLSSRARRSTSRSSKSWTSPAISWPCSWPLPSSATVAPGPDSRAISTARWMALTRPAPFSTRALERG